MGASLQPLIAVAMLGICTWSLQPNERGCAQSSASETPAPLVPWSIPLRWAAVPLLLCSAREDQDAARDGSSFRPLTADAREPADPFSFPLSLSLFFRAAPPGLCMLPGVANPGCWGARGCQGCSATRIYDALMYSSLPLAADALCKSAPQMSHAALHQL